MFNNSSGRKDFQAKQEGDSNEPMLPKYTSSSRQWGGLKNPRIVRVSKAFGGKDRHSKVCTVKGLRDRRIRLSVPSAIQLYDLQDRLGLSQPSKVIDWLLDLTKDDIDQLPPLQMLFGDCNQIYPNLNSTKVGDGNEGLNFFPIPQYSYSGLFPNNPYSNIEPCSNLLISQFGNQVVSSETDHSLMAPSSASQLLWGPPTAITPSVFPPSIMPNLGENHGLVRHDNYFHLLSSSSQQVPVPPNKLMPLFNLSDPQEKAPFGSDANLKSGDFN